MNYEEMVGTFVQGSAALDRMKRDVATVAGVIRGFVETHDPGLKGVGADQALEIPRIENRPFGMSADGVVQWAIRSRQAYKARNKKDRGPVVVVSCTVLFRLQILGSVFSTDESEAQFGHQHVAPVYRSLPELLRFTTDRFPDFARLLPHFAEAAAVQSFRLPLQNVAG